MLTESPKRACWDRETKLASFRYRLRPQFVRRMRLLIWFFSASSSNISCFSLSIYLRAGSGKALISAGVNSPASESGRSRRLIRSV